MAITEWYEKVTNVSDNGDSDNSNRNNEVKEATRIKRRISHFATAKKQLCCRL